MKRVIPLCDAQLRAVKPGPKDIPLFDGGGLYFLVKKNGAKGWRFKYRFGGKPHLISFGEYPAVSLEKARQERTVARGHLAAGVDPGVARQALRAANMGANTFKAVALEWFEAKRSGWSRKHANRIMSNFTRVVFPSLGDRPVTAITPPELLDVGRRVQRLTIPTAHFVMGMCKEVFKYAIGAGRAERNPAFDIQGLLKPKPKARNRAAVLDPDVLAELLRAMDSSISGFNVRCAMRLVLYLFQRPGELVSAEWKDINFARAEWSFQVTKKDVPHKVPLAHQAVDILRELKKMTGEGRFVFAQAANPEKHISTDTVRLAFRACGVSSDSFTPHGSRATAATMLQEILKFSKAPIERQLSHKVPDVNGTAYDRTQFIDERRVMMQEWADYLDGLKSGNIRAGNVA